VTGIPALDWFSLQIPSFYFDRISFPRVVGHDFGIYSVELDVIVDTMKERIPILLQAK